MRTITRIALALSLVPVLLAGTAQAYPTDSFCYVCHTNDPNVTVTVAPIGCSGTNYWYTLQVSNTYDGREGWAVFSGQTNLRNGYGNMASFMVGQDNTYWVNGVSDSTSGTGGWNSVVITAPHCGSCTDADGDHYYAEGGSCGAYDCNDLDAGVHPNATEIKSDGVDQDCNGYDFTITITTSTWSKSKKRLTVVATSGYGASANLELYRWNSASGSYVYVGPMTWDASSSTWKSVVGISVKPASVRVRGPEGFETATVTQVK